MNSIIFIKTEFTFLFKLILQLYYKSKERVDKVRFVNIRCIHTKKVETIRKKELKKQGGKFDETH